MDNEMKRRAVRWSVSSQATIVTGTVTLQRESGEEFTRKFRPFRAWLDTPFVDLVDHAHDSVCQDMWEEYLGTPEQNADWDGRDALPVEEILHEDEISVADPRYPLPVSYTHLTLPTIYSV